MGRRIGCSVKVGQLTEERKAVIDFLARELLQAFCAEALDCKGTHDAAVEHGVAVGGWSELGLGSEIAEEAAGKAVARAGGVHNFFQRECGHMKCAMGELLG